MRKNVGKNSIIIYIMRMQIKLNKEYDDLYKQLNKQASSIDIFRKDRIHLLLQKMIFIYNALLDGWTIKAVGGDGKFEFKQKKNKIKCDVNLEGYIQQFIKENMQLRSIY